MKIFWIVLISAPVAHYIVKKLTHDEDKANNAGAFFGVVAMAFLIVSIATKDPVFEPIGIPAGYEWVIGIGGGVGLLWKYVHKPLYDQVQSMDKRLVHVEGQLSGIKDDISLIKHKLLG
ncbi:hypothetical protein HYY69_07605 [Candidatus Woesearchaeota archaeon]|nr:hypothetical protein [Candidatus Woesearchaeota archaeon]